MQFYLTSQMRMAMTQSSNYSVTLYSHVFRSVIGERNETEMHVITLLRIHILPIPENRGI